MVLCNVKSWFISQEIQVGFEKIHCSSRESANVKACQYQVMIMVNLRKLMSNKFFLRYFKINYVNEKSFWQNKYCDIELVNNTIYTNHHVLHIPAFKVNLEVTARFMFLLTGNIMLTKQKVTILWFCACEKLHM